MDVSRSEAGADVRPQSHSLDATRLAVVQWLTSLRWDGVPRLHYAASAIVGGDLHAWRVIASLILAAVARAIRPGTHDVPVAALVGAQGCGKSALLNAFFGEWLAQHVGTPDVTSFPVSWCHEIDGESSSAIKALSAHSINVRMPYQRTPQSIPRWWVVAVTSNTEPSSLRLDVARISVVNLDRAVALRAQLFAEAFAALTRDATPKINRAAIAVRHVLTQASRDPRGLGRYIGPGAESFQLLALAEADRTGESPEDVFERYAHTTPAESQETRITLRVPLDEDAARDTLRAAASIVDARSRDDRDADLTAFARAMLDAETEAL